MPARSPAPLHPHADLIRSLGGSTAVARHLGLNVVHTVGKWSRRGVPAEYWPKLTAMAQVQGVSGVSWDVFEAGQKIARNAKKAKTRAAVA
jgi:hypothetical protein